MTYVHCNATEDHKSLKGQKYYTRGLHLLFLNSVFPLCPQRFVASFSETLEFAISFISLLLLPSNKKRKQEQPQHCGKAGVSSQPNSHTYSTSTTTEGLTFKINPNLAYQTKPPSLHYMDINTRTRGHEQRYAEQHIPAAITELQCSRANLPTQQWSSALKRPRLFQCFPWGHTEQIWSSWVQPLSSKSNTGITEQI